MHEPHRVSFRFHIYLTLLANKNSFEFSNYNIVFYLDWKMLKIQLYAIIFFQTYVALIL